MVKSNAQTNTRMNNCHILNFESTTGNGQVSLRGYDLFIKDSYRLQKFYRNKM